MYTCSKPTRPNFTKFSVHVTCNDRGSDFSEFVYLLFGAGVYGNLRDGGDTEDHGAWPVSLPQGPLELLQGPLEWFKDRWNCFDLFVVSLSLIELGLSGNKAFSILRAFRLVRRC